MHTHTHTDAHTHTHPASCSPAGARAHPHTQTNTRMHLHIDRHAYAHRQTCTYTQTDTHMHTQTRTHRQTNTHIHTDRHAHRAQPSSSQLPRGLQTCAAGLTAVVLWGLPWPPPHAGHFLKSCPHSTPVSQGGRLRRPFWCGQTQRRRHPRHPSLYGVNSERGGGGGERGGEAGGSSANVSTLEHARGSCLSAAKFLGN